MSTVTYIWLCRASKSSLPGCTPWKYSRGSWRWLRLSLESCVLRQIVVLHLKLTQSNTLLSLQSPRNKCRILSCVGYQPQLCAIKLVAIFSKSAQSMSTTPSFLISGQEMGCVGRSCFVVAIESVTNSRHFVLRVKGRDSLDGWFLASPKFL